MTEYHEFLPPYGRVDAEAVMAGFKHGPLPDWRLHPRYLISDNLRGPAREALAPQDPKLIEPVNVTCEDCGWRGAVEAYGKHRADIHAIPPRVIAPHAQVEHDTAVAKGHRAAAVKRERRVEAEPERMVECHRCIWRGPLSEYRAHREEAHWRYPQ